MLGAGSELLPSAGPRRRYALVVLLVALSGIVIYYPLLDSGYVGDDYLQLAMLDGRYPVPRSALDLYAFARSTGELERLRDAGTLPWWSHPEWRAAALRPLSSALIWLDHSVLGLSAFARHVHSLIWWTALLGAYALFVRRLMPFGAACLALLLFAINPMHLLPIWWLANRTALISGTFGIAGLFAYLRFREEGRRSALWVSGLLFGLSLAGGEYGLSAFAYLISYELFAGGGSLRQRALALAVPALPVVVFFAAFVALGFGAAASAWYVSPLTSPLEFLQQAALRLPALLANQYLLVTAEFSYLELLNDPVRVLWLAAPLSLVGLLLYGTIRLSPPATRRKLSFLLGGTLLALIPLMGTVPSARLLELPGVGGSALLAALFWDGWSRFKERASFGKLALWSRLFLTVGLAYIHLVRAPLESIRHARALTAARQTVQDIYLSAAIDDRWVAQQDLMLLNAPDPMLLLYVPHVRFEAGRPAPRVWRALSMTLRPILARRTDQRTLELSTIEGSLLEMPVARLVRRDDQWLRPGEHIELPRLAIDVLEATPEGPKKLRFRFEQNLDHPSLVLLAAVPGRLVRWTPPRVGAEQWVPMPL